MTATRMGAPLRLATLAVLGGCWAAAAFLLWDTTRVPGGLRTAGLHARDYFSASLLRRGDHYEQFLRLDSLLAAAATIVVFVVYARVGAQVRPRVGGRADRHRDAARDARLRARLARRAPVRDRRALVGAALRGVARQLDGYLSLIFGGWLQLGGTFAFLSVAVLVVMGLARLVGQRGGFPARPSSSASPRSSRSSCRTSYTDTHPLRDPRLAAAGARARRAGGGARHPGRGRDGLEGHRRRQRLHGRVRPDPARSSSGTRSSTAASRGEVRCRARPRVRPSGSRPPAEGDRLVRRSSRFPAPS